MTDATVPATALEPVLAGALQLLRDNPGATLEALAAEVVTEPVPAFAAEAEPFPKLPKHVELTDEVSLALKRLADIFNSVEPGKRRSLSQSELDLLTIEQTVLGLIGSTMATRMETVKEIIRNHMDVAAEEAGVAVPRAQVDPGTGEVIVAATPRDQNGHYLLARPQEPHQVQAGPVFWSQEYNAATPKPSDGVLQAAFRDGTVSREDYLAVTREIRVFDTIKARDLIRQAPERGLAVLRRITVGGPAKASLFLRKQGTRT